LARRRSPARGEEILVDPASPPKAIDPQSTAVIEESASCATTA
jgi:hypothetical protein